MLWFFITTSCSYFITTNKVMNKSLLHYPPFLHSNINKLTRSKGLKELTILQIANLF